MTNPLGPLPADAAGADTLEIMSAAPRYAAWQVEVITPWLGRRILEVGSGIGNISRELRALDPESLTLTDTDPWYLNRLRAEYREDGKVSFAELTLPDANASDHFRAHQLDTVVALNVLEHIPDHLGSLRSMAAMVRPGGHIVLLVPALPVLYGSLDRELQHVRRYTKSGLRHLMAEAGLLDVRTAWFNRVGMLGWWFNARVRKVPRIPIGQLRTFDALVPLLRHERLVPLPFAQSLLAVGTAR